MQTADVYATLLNRMAHELPDEVLNNTPERAAKAWGFITSGHRQSLHEVVGRGIFPATNTDMVLVKNIEFYSLCEHHLLPFFGFAHVAYVPDKKIIGLSKIPRIVNMCSRRLQIQERLARQIAEALDQVLSPSGVGVAIEGRHLCAMMRGVEKQHTIMKSAATIGCFREDDRSRGELMALMQRDALRDF